MEDAGTSKPSNWRVFRDPTSLSRAVAGRLVEVIQRELEDDDRFSLFLSGGSTPRPLYRRLAGTFRERIPWMKLHLFWGDERFVSPDHPDSNYRMARQALIDSVPIPDDHVHPILTRSDSVDAAAREYERTLREHFDTTERGGPKRSPDCVLLGVGTDGHTASLFPGDPALDEQRRWVRAVGDPGGDDQPRITVTLPFLRRVKRGYFVVSGSEKRDVLREISRARSTGRDRYPAAQVQTREELMWFIDREADPFDEESTS